MTRSIHATRRLALAAGLACLAAPALVSAQASAWPGKPVTIVVPFPPGGGTDAFARPLFAVMTKNVGRQFIIDNKGGAGGTLGAGIAAKAAPDGYTFIAPAASHTTTPSLYSKLSFDPVKDFAAVTQIVTVPYLLVVPASSPMQTLADFIAAAKAKPGTLTFGSAGNGSSNHLAGELLAGSIGAPLVHVPYKGSGPALADVLGGQLSFMFDTINTSTGHVKAGRLRVLGVGTPKRSKIMPDVAPIADTIPGFEAVTWIGLLAPAGTPKEIVARMHREIEKIVQLPDVQERLSASGAEPVASTPEQFGAYLGAEVAKWGRVVKQAKIPPVQ